MVAGWVIMVSTAPRLSARPHSLTPFMTVLPASRPPVSSKEIMPLKPDIWALAMACWGCEGRPG